MGQPPYSSGNPGAPGQPNQQPPSPYSPGAPAYQQQSGTPPIGQPYGALNSQGPGGQINPVVGQSTPYPQQGYTPQQPHYATGGQQPYPPQQPPITAPQPQFPTVQPHPGVAQQGYSAPQFGQPWQGAYPPSHYGSPAFTPPKQKRTGLIIAIVLIVIALIAAAVFAFIRTRENPEVETTTTPVVTASPTQTPTPTPTQTPTPTPTPTQNSTTPSSKNYTYCLDYLLLELTLTDALDDLGTAQENSDIVGASAALAEILTTFNSLQETNPPEPMATDLATVITYLTVLKGFADANDPTGYNTYVNANYESGVSTALSNFILESEKYCA